MQRRTTTAAATPAWRRLCLLAAGTLVAATACSSVVPDDIDFAAARCQLVIDDGVDGLPTFDLGALLEVTTPEGAVDEYSAGYIRAMRLAIEELNDGRDIGGRRVRLRVCDTHADWAIGGGQISRDLATWLIDEAGVEAIIADASTETQTIQSVTVARSKLLMAISATSEDLTWLADDGLVWRVAPSDVYQGIVLAHMASQTVAASDTIAVVAVKSPYGDGLAASISMALGKRAAVHTFDADGGGIDAAVAGAAADNAAAVIVVASVGATAEIVNQRAKHAELSGAALFLADGACDGSLMDQPLDTGVSLVGARCTRPGQPPTATYNSFAERFSKAYGADPAETAYAQHAFDVVYCIALAHAWALGSGGDGNVSGKAIAEGLKHLSAGEPYPFMPNRITAMVGSLLKGEDINVDGASGPLNFNPETGEAPSGYETQKVDAAGKLVSDGWFGIEDLGGGKYKVGPIEATP